MRWPLSRGPVACTTRRRTEASRSSFPPARERPSDLIPSRIRLEAQPVLRLELRHDPQPFLLAALANGLDRPAAMRREARPEDHARVAEVGIRDDLLAHARDRLVQGREHHAL